ncbi:hypothetical protein [Halorarum halobium]|uniref:hypothetical protein n=1 Tax=Halorarum halobium TaxID=3075121 RepID=UPI0028AFCF6E|nr:hypothetical protein [Halobaculum sp. XH14]
MSGSLPEDLWQTGKFAVGYYRGDKTSLISRGIDAVSPLLLILVVAFGIGHYHGIVSAADLLRVLGVTALIGAIDLTLILDLSIILDFLIGDIFGLVGLRNLLTGLAALGLGGPVVNYFRALRNQ